MIGICRRAGTLSLGLILIAAFSGLASAQGASPSFFITSIYKLYTSKTIQGRAARYDGTHLPLFRARSSQRIQGHGGGGQTQRGADA